MDKNSSTRSILKDINNAAILIQQQQQQQEQQNFKNSTIPFNLNDDALVDIENKPIINKSTEEATIKSPPKINAVEVKTTNKPIDINIENDHKDKPTSLINKITEQITNNSLPDILDVVPAITFSEAKTNHSILAGEFINNLEIDTNDKSFNEDEQEFLTPKLIITEASANSSDDEIFTECHSSPQPDIESPSTVHLENNIIDSLPSEENQDMSEINLKFDTTTKVVQNENLMNIGYDNVQPVDPTTISDNSQDAIDIGNNQTNVDQHNELFNEDDIDMSLFNNIFSNLKLNNSEIPANSKDESIMTFNNLVTTNEFNAPEIAYDSVLKICPVNNLMSLEKSKSDLSEIENNSETLDVNKSDLKKENNSYKNMISTSCNEKEVNPNEICIQEIACDSSISPDLSNSSSSNGKISECGSLKLNQFFDDDSAELSEDSFLENEKRVLNITLKNPIPVNENLEVSLNSSACSGQNDITTDICNIPQKSTESVNEITRIISPNLKNNQRSDLRSEAENFNETINLNYIKSMETPSNNIDLEFTDRDKVESDLNTEIQSIQNALILNQKENSPMVDSIENILIKSTNSEMFDSLEQQKSISEFDSTNHLINDNQSHEKPNLPKSAEILDSTTNTIEKNLQCTSTAKPEKHPQFDNTFDQLTLKSLNAKIDYSNVYDPDSTRSITPTDLYLTKDITAHCNTPTDLNLTKDITAQSNTPTDLNITRDTRRSITPTDLNLTKDITRSESIDDLNQTNALGCVKGSFEAPIPHLKLFNSTVKIGGSDLNHTFNTNSQESIPLQNNQTFCGDVDTDSDSNLNDCGKLNVTHNLNDGKTKNSIDEDMFMLPRNISNGRKSLQMTKEEFSSNGMILNPSDFEFLLTKGSNDIVPDNRNSLLLKFDPLAGRPILVNQALQQPIQDTNDTQKLKKLNPIFPQVEESEEDTYTPNKNLVNLSSCETLKKENCTSNIESLKQRATAKINKLIFDKKGNDKMSVDVIQDLNITSDIKSLNSINSNEINDKKLLKMEELETKVQNEVGKTEDLEKKLKESVQREEALLKRITEKDKTIAKLGIVIEEYEKAIAEAIAEKEHLTQNYEKQLQEIKNDRDLNYQHLASLESTFADLHLKYERSKQTTAKLRASEEELLAEKKQNLENLHLQEQRYEKMKNHAMQQLDIANNKLEFLTKNHAMEITKLKALLKKEEISKASVSEQLQQKSRENEELMKICDELINGGQNS